MSRYVRALFDTNVFISYLLPSATSETIATIIEAAVKGAFTLMLPDELVKRFAITIAKKRYLAQRIRAEDTSALIDLLVRVSAIIPPIEGAIPSFCRHVKDDYLIAYALVGEADYLVTGDEDLPVLGEVGRVKIVTPNEFLEILRETAS